MRPGQSLRAVEIVRPVLAPADIDHDQLVARLLELPRDELVALYDAAAEAVACATALAENGTNPVTEVLAGADTVTEWDHFPASDVVDPETHSQFYYHAHAAEERVAGEHGHFHTFVRPKPLFPDLAPVAVPDGAGDEPTWVAHLVGISTDASGNVIRLFTTNRWVTGEVWYGADSVVGMLDRFAMTGEAPSPELNRWVTAVLAMFRPQIADLLLARDARLAQYRAAHPAGDVLEDRALQVTSEVPANFLAQIRAIETALQHKSSE
ncbi:MAG TPA: hypothetical protein VG986_10595 [Pseudolabrys sp.]|nr:hypothetical protein [Pseudolabrys sp.]